MNPATRAGQVLRSRPEITSGRPVIRQGEKLQYYMNYYVYILLLSNNQLYTDFTSKLNERLKQHKTGNVKSTRNRRPIKLIHYEAYTKESDAHRREKYLKTTEGKRFLKQQIRDLLTSIKK